MRTPHATGRAMPGPMRSQMRVANDGADQRAGTRTLRCHHTPTTRRPKGARPMT